MRREIPMRQSPELQREHARDLICAWALVTESLLGACDAETIERMFEAAKARTEGWSEERRAAELTSALSGELTATVFNPEFVAGYRRSGLSDDE